MISFLMTNEENLDQDLWELRGHVFHIFTQTTPGRTTQPAVNPVQQTRTLKSQMQPSKTQYLNNISSQKKTLI